MSELWFLTRSVCIVAAMYRPFRKHCVTLIKKQGDECARGFNLSTRVPLMKMSSLSTIINRLIRKIYEPFKITDER